MDRRAFEATLAEFKATLIRAQSERLARGGWTDQEGTPLPEWVPHAEPGWVLFERQVMVDAVNRVRRNAGLPESSRADVERAERQAVGHSDYTAKFALYCTELALS